MWIGSMAIYVPIPRIMCTKIDDLLTFEQGAAMLCVYITAAMALIDKANLQPAQVGSNLAWYSEDILILILMCVATSTDSSYSFCMWRRWLSCHAHYLDDWRSSINIISPS